MKLVSILGITLFVAVMALMEWPKFRHLHREKMAFATFSVIGYILAVLLVLYPDLPGTTQMFSVIYKPFEKILEK